MAETASAPGDPLQGFSQIVEAIYDCALDPGRWGDTVRQIADWSDSRVCALGVHDYTNGRNELAFQFGYEESYIRLHHEEYKDMDPFFHAGLLLPVGVVKTQAMLVDDAEFYNSRYFLEWCMPQGLADMASFKVLQTGRLIGWLAVNRLATQVRYSQADVERLSLLAPHVCRAVAISDALGLQSMRSEALAATLDALAAGVYLLDRYGRAIYLNRAAESQVSTGASLWIENDRLVLADPAAQAAMEQAIENAAKDEAATTSCSSLAISGKDGNGLIAALLSLTGGERRSVFDGFTAIVALFVQNPVSLPPFPGEAFAKLHGLTGSELRVVMAMSRGLGVKDAAKLLGIGETTAKTHLQHVYSKTGTSKRSELMRQLMSSMPPIVPV